VCQYLLLLETRGGGVVLGAKGPPSLIMSDRVVVVGLNTSRCSKREVEGLSWAKSGGEGKNPSLSCSDISVC
jgi:hypothetical protein